MKRSLIIAVSAIIIVAAIVAMCLVPTAAYNNTSKTNTYFQISDDGVATVDFGYHGYEDVNAKAVIEIVIENVAAKKEIVRKVYESGESVYYDTFKHVLTENGTYKCTVVYTVSGDGGEADIIRYTKEARCKNATSTSSTKKPDHFIQEPVPGITSIEDPMYGMEDVDFGGYTFTFASCINATDGWPDREIYAEENSTSVLDAAINRRNNVILNNYNCYIQAIDIDTVTVTNDFMTNSGRVDILGYKYNIHTKGNGNYINFYELDIDLSAPWWDNGFIKDMTVDNQLYGIIGSFSISSFDATTVLYFNKTVKESNEHLDDIDFYELVDNNEWTIDKFFEIVKKAYSDDTYGYGSVAIGSRELYFGAGQSYSVKTDDEQGNSSFTHAFTEAASMATDKIIEIFAHESVRLVSYDTVNSDFVSGKALFAHNTLSMASEYAATMDGSGKAVDFGILPNPKLSSEQAKYKHTIDDHMIYICVPRTCADRTRISDFLTLYAYHSYHTVYAKYLELYKYTYTTDAKAGEMVDIILGSRCFDLADHLSWGPNDPEYVGAGVEHTYVTSVTAGKNPIPALLENKIGDIIENCGNMYKDYLAENNG